MLYLLVQGLRFVKPEYFVTRPSAGFSEAETGGFLDPLIGTLSMVLIAMAIAFPIGLGIGVWLSEWGRPGWLARVIESTIEMLAGTPSIVFALFGVLLFRNPVLSFFSSETEAS